MESNVYLTPKIKRWISSARDTQRLSNNDEKELSKIESYENHDDSIIPFRLVKAMYVALKPESCLYLHELLEGSSIHLPKYEPPPRNPVLEERVQKLKADQENLKYRHMTKNVNYQTKDESLADIGKELKSLNRHLITVVNFVLSVLGAFTFGYKAVEYSQVHPNIPMQMAGGLVFATSVFFADLYFILKFEF